jgi:hypothetical protein
LLLHVVIYIVVLLLPDVVDSSVLQQPASSHNSAAHVKPTAVPDAVRNFCTHLNRHLYSQNVYELHGMYEASFNRITEKFFTKSTWPSPDLISPLVDNGKSHILLCLCV